MKMENKKLSVRDDVISKIEQGEVKMKSKRYFVSKTVLIFGFTALFSLLALYTGSFIFFILEENAILTLSNMGIEGLKLAILSFPWHLVVLVLSVTVLVEVMLKRFSFIYKRPLIYSMLAILLLVIVGSVVMGATSVHRSFFDLAEQDRLPVMGGLYRHFADLDIEHVHFGEILEVGNGKVVMELEGGEVVDLNITKSTKGYRRISEELEEGRNIVVIGEKYDGEIDVIRFKGLNRGFRKNER